MSKTFCHCGGEIINGHHCTNGHLMLRNVSHTAIPVEEDKPKLTRSQWMMLDSAFFMLSTNYPGEHVMLDAIAELRAKVFEQFSKEI